MATRALPYVTPEQYLEFERRAKFKHEYLLGKVVRKPRGPVRRAGIIANAICELGTRLADGPCRVYSSALRVALNPKTGYVYPDVTVACGPLEYVDSKKDTITNPKVAVEVASLEHSHPIRVRLYLNSPLLSDFIFIDQDRIGVEHWHRSNDGDAKRTVVEDPNGILDIPSLDCKILVSRLYLGVELPAAGE